MAITEAHCLWQSHRPGEWETSCQTIIGLPGMTDPIRTGFVYCPTCGGRVRMFGTIYPRLRGLSQQEPHFPPTPQQTLEQATPDFIGYAQRWIEKRGPNATAENFIKDFDPIGSDLLSAFLTLGFLKERVEDRCLVLTSPKEDL